ncbi:MAG: hypothetical protein ABIH21_01270 [Patescibacteria group bacterium]
MKKIFIIVAMLVFAGAGCIYSEHSGSINDFPNTYENQEFGFSYGYPQNMDIHVREGENRVFNYMNQDVDFFGSLRDLSRSERPDNIIYMYAVDGAVSDKFEQIITDSGLSEGIVSNEVMKVNNLKVRKIVNNTQSQDEKAHYIFENNGKTIIFSVFIGEDERFWPILKTLTVIK